LISFLWRLWVYFNFIIWLLLIGPVVYVSIFILPFSKTYKLIRIWAYLNFYLSGFSYTLQSEIQLNTNQQYILISNHTSMIDILLMFILHPNHPIAFVGKKELVKIPIFGAVYKKLCVMVDRESIKSKAKVYALSIKKIREGRNLVIFPEGGVPDDTSLVLDKFKDGAFSIGIEANIPIVVYTFVGIKEQFPFDHFKGFPGTTNVFREEILLTENNLPENKIILKETAFKLIYNRLNKLK